MQVAFFKCEKINKVTPISDMGMIKLELSENLTIPPLKCFQSIQLVSLTKNVERKKNTGKNK